MNDELRAVAAADERKRVAGLQDAQADELRREISHKETMAVGEKQLQDAVAERTPKEKAEGKAKKKG